MTSPAIDFREQPGGGVPREIRPSEFRDATRVQRSFLTAMEKRALLWLAERTPRSVNSDHLTILGLLAQGMAGVCYALARGDRDWLLAVIGFLALNWLGDSLDGTLAR